MHNTPKDEIFVVGHKNPDTDSICSAIAYANLKNQKENKYVPKRAGKINKETEYVLKYFGVPVPELIVDANTQVKDIAYRLVDGVDGDITIRKAWDTMQKNDATTLPVLIDNKVQGIITVGDIAESYIENKDRSVLHNAKTKLRHIAETIDGEIIVGNPEDVVKKGKIVVGAAHVDVMTQFIDPGDIVLLADRESSQISSIENGASLIILCLVDDVSENVINEAKEKGCAIISTVHDTYTTSKLVEQSLPVSSCMVKDNIISFHEDDDTEILQAEMAKTRVRYFPVVDYMGNYKGLVSRRNYINARKKQIILVDHNEISQAVDNIEKADIIEIIDHHRIGSIETISPVYFRNMPLGCTATIVYQMYKEKGVVPTPAIAGLMVAAILSDTLMFKSPTCTKIDEELAKELAELAGIDIAVFADQMFNEASNIKGKSMHDVLHTDFKKFIIGGKTIGIGQISSLNRQDLIDLKISMRDYLLSREKTDSDIIIYVGTNIIEEGSDIVCVGDGAVELCKKAFGGEFGDNTAFIKGIISRKKQIVPALVSAMQG